MQYVELLGAGFATAITPGNLLCGFVGCLWGTIVGILPGLGPLAGMSLLLPLTFALEPSGALIMLSGIFYGAMYGGSLTSILLRIPGEAASVITCIDGHEMARQGRAGPALSISAIGSWVGGMLSVVGLMLFAPPLSQAMLGVGPPAEFVLLLAALLVTVAVSNNALPKTFSMILLGLLFGTVGADSLSGDQRFSFGDVRLADGLNFVAMALGLFGISELLLNLEESRSELPRCPTLRELVPSKADLAASAGPVARGSVIGFFFGMVPGLSHITSTLVSYVVERKLSRTPERFGHGAIEGVAGPETANNATTGSAMVPLLTLGIPAIPSTAILLSAMMIHGVQPGPLMMIEHPDVFWGLIASMFIGNTILLVLNLPLVGLFVNILKIPYPILAPLILVISFIGVYSVSYSSFDIGVMTAFGVLGYVLRKFDFDVAPMLLAVVIGERMERTLRQSLTISNGDWEVFFRGVAGWILLAASFIILGSIAWSWISAWRGRQRPPSADPLLR